MSENIKRGDFFHGLFKKNKNNIVNEEVAGTDEPREASPQNKFFTPEQWFEKYYQGEADQDLPKNVFKDASPELIKDLKDKYSFRAPTKNPEVKQTDLFDEKI